MREAHEQGHHQESHQEGPRENPVNNRNIHQVIYNDDRRGDRHDQAPRIFSWRMDFDGIRN